VWYYEAVEERTMGKIDDGLYQKLAAEPDQSVALIVRTAGDPQPHLQRLAELGLDVRRRFKMLPGVAVTGSANAALKLLGEGWVTKIEEDRPVHTMR
jgi:hypothetical protein